MIGGIILYYLFSDPQKTKIMVEGAYKKLKAHFFYDKTQLFMKSKIADFEHDEDSFKKNIILITNALKDNDENYFYSLMDKISYQTLPKSFASQHNNTLNDLINTSLEYDKQISKTITFIDAPIELYIIDCLWTLLLGKKYCEKENVLKYSAATKFKKNLFCPGEDLFESIDFKSNRLFEPYYNLYTKWSKNAFNTIKKSKDSSDKIMISTDIKDFYNSIPSAEFKQFTIFDTTLTKSFQFLTKTILDIQLKYSLLLNKDRNKNRLSLPIGLISSILLREIYMESIDKEIEKKLQPIYYSRYVDDIIIVIECADEKKIKTKKEALEFLKEKKILEQQKNGFIFSGYPCFVINEEKTNCFYFPKDTDNLFIDMYEKQVKKNSSEANMLPDIELLQNSFESVSYTIENINYSESLKALGCLKNNSYNASRFIYGLQMLLKNTCLDQYDTDKYLTPIMKFYKGSQCIEYSNHWTSIFELFVICNEPQLFSDFFQIIKNEILKINLPQTLEHHKKSIVENLIQKLRISASIALALSPSFLDVDSLEKMDLQKEFIDSIKKSNMFNHNLVIYPLLNYSQDPAISLRELNPYRISLATLSPFKLQWTPRFIHFIEFDIINSFASILNNSEETYDTTKNKIYKIYTKTNNIQSKCKENILSCKITTKLNTTNIIYNLDTGTEDSPRIALVNTSIDQKSILQPLQHPHKNLTPEKLNRLFKILNVAKEEAVDIIVFPEFYFPRILLNDIAKFATKNKISIITGLEYFTDKQPSPKNTTTAQAYNCVCNIIPIKFSNSFYCGGVFLREKNFYAPKEKELLSQLYCSCTDTIKPNYITINTNSYRYSTILCYEFTDIISRAAFKSQIEVLFVPQFNRDTNYFASIVESTSRDLHCFIVQANTLDFGDSRITAPYDSVHKNLMQIKGGETDVVMITTLNISDLLAERHIFNSYLNAIPQCAKCKKHLKKRSSFNLKQCENCNKLFPQPHTENHIKGLPPNFSNN